MFLDKIFKKKEKSNKINKIFKLLNEKCNLIYCYKIGFYLILICCALYM